MESPLIGGGAGGNGAGTPGDLIKDATTATFMTDVIDASMSAPVLVDFWAPWCGPCRALGPTIDKLAEDFDGKAQVGKLNIDEHPQLAAKFGVSSIPTVMVFKNGDRTDQFVGLRQYDARQRQSDGGRHGRLGALGARLGILGQPQSQRHNPDQQYHPTRLGRTPLSRRERPRSLQLERRHTHRLGEHGSGTLLLGRRRRIRVHGAGRHDREAAQGAPRRLAGAWPHRGQLERWVRAIYYHRRRPVDCI